MNYNTNFKNFTKALIVFLWILCFFSFSELTVFSNCTFNLGSNVWNSLDSCLNASNLVDGSNTKIWWTGDFINTIKGWVHNISLYLWVLAVWSIAYWSLMLTLSAWEEEKVNKAKDIIKWWLIWFIWLISITAIVNLVVKIMYSI